MIAAVRARWLYVGFAAAFHVLLTAHSAFATVPSIIRNSPSSTNYTISAGTTIAFSIEATDPDGDLKAADWYLGSTEVKWDPWSGRPLYYHASQWSRTFSTAGTYYVYLYVDDDAGNSPFIYWQITVNPPPPTGTINASSSSCTIAAGNSSCNVTLTWNVTNPVGTSEVTSNTPTSGYHIEYGNSGSKSVPVFYSSRTFFLIDGNTLDDVTVSASCASGSSWNGSICQAPPTGNISASSSSCTIAAGNSSCNVTLTWSVSNPVGTSEVTSNTPTSGYHIEYGNSGSKSVPVFYSSRTFFLIDGNTLDDVTVSASCASGSSWNGSICQAPPTGNISASSSSCTITAGNSSCNVTLTWSVSNPVGTSEVTSNTPTSGYHIEYGNSGSKSVPVFYSSRTFFLIDGNTLDDVTVAASCAAGSTWNGSICLATPTGTISATPSSCTITAGNSSCDVTLTWSVNNPVGTSEVTSNTPTSGYHIEYGNSGSKSVPVFHSSRTFFLIDGNTLDDVTVSASCAAGSAWNGSICLATPTGTISATPSSCTISAGNSSCDVTLTWSVNNPVGTSEVTSNTPASGYHIEYGNSGSRSVPVFYSSRTFFLIDGNTLDDVTVSASCAAGSTWNGSICLATPTGTISATPSSCTIAAGNSSCDVNLTWSVVNPVGTSEVTSNTPTPGYHIEYGNSGSKSVPVFYSSRTFFLIDGNTLDDVTVSASCAIGSIWNGSICLATPTGTISATPTSCTIASGDSSCNVNLTWSVINPVGTSEVTSNTPTPGYHIEYGNSGSKSVPVFYSNRKFFLIDGDTLDQVTVPASCAAGSIWNGNICQSYALTLSSDGPACDTVPPAAGPSPVVRLRWTDLEDATSYDVYRNGALIGSGLPQGTFAWKDWSGVGAGMSYSYYVRAHTGAGTSQSNSITVAVPTNICATSLPSQFSLSNDPPVCDTEGQSATPAARLNWSNSSWATSYDVYRDGRLYASGVRDAPTFYDLNVATGGILHYYFVRARNAVGFFDSNTVTVAVSPFICDNCLQKDCDDLDRCTDDHCDPSNGECIHTAIPLCCLPSSNCADTDDCTFDYCGPDATCKHAEVASCGECVADTDCSGGECPIGFCNGGESQCQCVDPSLMATYVALGDSYSAGEGNPEFEDGTDTSGCHVSELSGQVAYCLEDRCHRSSVAYPNRFNVFGHQGVPVASEAEQDPPRGAFRFLACSGAKIENVLPVSDGGSQQYPAELPQLDAQLPAGTDVVTITIGGNDAGFAPILMSCLSAADSSVGYSGPPTSSRCELKEAATIARINALEEPLYSLYGTIKEELPGAAVFVLGYPQIVASPTCDDVRVIGKYKDAIPYDRRLTNDAIDYLQRVTLQMNRVIEQAALRAGVFFVDVLDGFAGHELCGSAHDPWFTKPNPDHSEYSFHPTADGQAAYANELQAFLGQKRASGAENGFSALGIPNNPSPSDALVLASDPRAAVEEMAEVANLTVIAFEGGCGQRTVAAPGAALNIRGEGYTPHEMVQIELVTAPDVPRQTLGSVEADDSGDIDTIVTIPVEDASTGAAFVLAVGTSATTGAPRESIAMLNLMPVAESDVDLDGTRDDCDNCPALANDQEDADQDSVGDACDTCPQESENDADGDGVCAPADSCSRDPQNDQDADGVCGDHDGCPGVPDPGQEDSNADGLNDACHCAEGAICRSQVGVCDVPELCLHGTCPDDTFAGNQVVCRLSTNDCDTLENCSGLSAACPADATEPDGTVCDDGLYCDGEDTCNSGTCSSHSGNPCGTGNCNESTGCSCNPGTFTIQPGPEGKDTYWGTAFSKTGAPDNPQLSFGGWDDYYYDYLEFALDGAPPASETTKAELWLYVTGASVNDAQLGVYRVTQSWAESDPMSTSSPASLSLGSAGISTKSTGWKVIDVTTLYKNWKTGVYPNYGIELVPKKNNQTNGAFASSDNADASLRPKLVVTTSGNCACIDGTLCRAASGVCDQPEYCNGGACPANSFLTSTTTCRASAGICDFAEQCTGASANCPADGKSTAACRTAAGVCDATETCDGSTSTCPGDLYRSTTTTCRASGGVCDLPERCTGMSSLCPGDELAVSGTTCRSALGVCDFAESCSGASKACPADSKSTAVCRPGTDTCDPAETCSGSAAVCPVDVNTCGATVCIVGTGSAPSCTESALNYCLPGGLGFTGDVAFNCGGPASIAVTGIKTIDSDTNIDGGGQVTIDGGHSVAIFFVSGSTVDFAVQDLTIANGYGGEAAGGIINFDGTVLVSGCKFTGNSNNVNSGGAYGGGIYSQGTLYVTETTFSNNTAFAGAGIYGFGNVIVTNSTFSGNTASAGGAAIYSRSALTVTNSTFSGNTANSATFYSSFSGAIGFDGTATITNCTFSGNGAGYGGAVGVGNGSTLTVTNSILANSAAGGNCGIYGTVIDGGHNLDSDGTCGVGPATSPLLDPAGLKNNGGPTETIALCEGAGVPTPACIGVSPAINAGDESVCSTTTGAAPVGNLDQRGWVRPGDGATNCSIGAFEADLTPATVCGDATGDLKITVADALFALRAAINSVTCDLNLCDYNGSGHLTAADALAILRVSVGQDVEPRCPDSAALGVGSTIPVSTTLQQND